MQYCQMNPPLSPQDMVDAVFILIWASYPVVDISLYTDSVVVHVG